MLERVRCTLALLYFVLYFSAQTASSFFPLGVIPQHETIPFYFNSRISKNNNNNNHQIKFQQYPRCKTSLFASNKPYQLCILGGGFGGVNTALTLASLEADDSNRELEITLIDPKERFVFLPLLYELCVGDASLEEVAPTYTSLFHQGQNNKRSKVQWKQGTVIGVDVKNSCVFYNATSPMSMQKINYDALVLCTGLDATPSPTIPGAQQLAHTFYTLEDCYALRKQLNNVLLSSSSNSSRHVVVVGAGYSGVELSLNIKTFFQKQKADVQVTLVHRGQHILPSASDFNRDSARKRLNESNIQLLTETSVANVTQEGSKKIVQLSFRNGNTHDRIASDLVVWTVGANPPKKGILNSMLPRDQSERIMTRSTLQVVGFNNIFALGDCAKVVGGTSSYPATAQVAIQQAAVVAWNVCEVLNHPDSTTTNVDEALLPFRYVELGEMMTLGTDDATIQSLGGLFQASGKGASALRRFIYAARMPTNKQRLTALVDSTAYLAANTILLDKQKRSKNFKKLINHD